MFVINRRNIKEEVSFDKILNRIKEMVQKLNIVKDIDSAGLSQKIVSRMYSGISTSELDDLTARICIDMMSIHMSYEKLACHISINNIHKNTTPLYKTTYEMLHNIKNVDDNVFSLVNDNFMRILDKHSIEIQKMLDYDRDYDIGYFGIKTLEKAYLLKVNGKIIERPQQMFMRVAIGIHDDDLKKVKSTYDMLSKGYFTHATPTLFNASTPRQQMSSCFLAGMDDSIESIFETTGELAKISKWAGGIGLSISNIRGSGSVIRGTGGESLGIMPLMKMLNSVATYINQGGKRNGSFAMYIEPWHCDIFTFLDAKKNHGVEERRARDLFYGLWIPDLFMERVKSNGNWTLMCPDKCKGLDTTYGDEFKELYEKYEKEEGRINKVVRARDVWAAIISSQIETGGPYMLYKDACNQKSNQKNIGTIRSSNLCAEIVEYSDSTETAVCNLASICLPKILEEVINEDYLNTHDGKVQRVDIDKYINTELKVYTKESCVYCKLVKSLFNHVGVKYREITEEEDKELQTKYPNNEYKTVPRIYNDNEFIGGYDDAWNVLKPKINYDKLVDITDELTVNLNKIIDTNYYPTEKTFDSNNNHRPIGIGVQGLADLFIKLRIPFDSEEANEVNKRVFETIYYGAMKTSNLLAEQTKPYKTFEGSPLSEGKFQFNLWGLKDSDLSGLWNWNELRQKVISKGVKNSLLIALMPTASTSQIMGNNECIEPYTSNVYVRRTIAGEFTCVNKHLINDLQDIDLWTPDIREKLLYDRGSVQNIKQIPLFLRNIYKTTWEIKQKKTIDLSVSRAPFVCQSQSLNLWIEKPTFDSLTTIHFYGWSKGLKTGSYYIRSKPASQPQRFGMDASKEKQLRQNVEEEDCLSCGA